MREAKKKKTSKNYKQFKQKNEEDRKDDLCVEIIRKEGRALLICQFFFFERMVVRVSY